MGKGRARSGQETGRRRRAEPEVSGGRGIVSIAPFLEFLDAGDLCDVVPIQLFLEVLGCRARAYSPRRFANDLANM